MKRMGIVNLMMIAMIQALVMAMAQMIPHMALTSIMPPTKVVILKFRLTNKMMVKMMMVLTLITLM
jgi:hypothetical protein